MVPFAGQRSLPPALSGKRSRQNPEQHVEKALSKPRGKAARTGGLLPAATTTEAPPPGRSEEEKRQSE